MLAEWYSNRIFEPACMTEDYENGFRINRLGLPQKFIPIQFRHGRPIATREFFPLTFRLGRPPANALDHGHHAAILGIPFRARNSARISTGSGATAKAWSAT